MRSMVTSVLLFLAIHPKGASRDQILESAWTNPDGSNNGSSDTLRATLNDARNAVRKLSGDSKRMYVSFRSNRHQFNEDEVATDIGRFHRFLATANRTRSDEERIGALTAAVDCYRDHLGLGINADWLIIDREAESRCFGDAWLSADGHDGRHSP